MARQVFSLLPGYHPSVGAHRRPQRVGSAFSHHLIQSPNGHPRLLRLVAGPPGPRTDFASPSADGLQGLRGACITRDRVSLSRAMLRGVNHRSEVTESPIEIQLRVLRTTLGDDLVRDLEDSVAPNTWRAYRSTWPTSPPGWPAASLITTWLGFRSFRCSDLDWRWLGGVSTRGGSQARYELPREARSDSTCCARWGCCWCPRWGSRPPCARWRVAPRRRAQGGSATRRCARP